MAAILKKSAAILDFQVAHRADLTSSPQRTFVPNLVLVSQFARLVPLSALLLCRREVALPIGHHKRCACECTVNVHLFIVNS